MAGTKPFPALIVGILFLASCGQSIKTNVALRDRRLRQVPAAPMAPVPPVSPAAPVTPMAPVAPMAPMPPMASAPGAASVVRQGPLDLKTYPLPQQDSQVLKIYMSLFVFVAAIPFGYLLPYGQKPDVATWQLLAGAIYMAASSPFCLLRGLLDPIWQCAASFILAGIAAWGGLQPAMPVRERIFMIWGAVLAAALLIALKGGLSWTLSPAYTGLAGAIFNTGTFGSSLAALTIIYVSALGLTAAVLFFIIRWLVKRKRRRRDEDEEDEDEPPRRTEWNAILGSFIVSYPIAAAVSQLLFISGAFVLSPLDAASLFSVPSSMRLAEVSTYVSLLVWIGLACLAFYFRTVWSRQYVENPTLIADVVHEHWRRETMSSEENE